MNTIVSQQDLKQKIDTLPWDLSELIYEHYHKIYMKSSLLKIKSVSLEIQEVWTFMNRIYKFCSIDFINHYINKFIIKNEPYGILPDKKFESQMMLLLKTLENGYKLFENYCNSQLKLIFYPIEFTSVSTPLFPGLFLEASIRYNDLINWIPLYTKYKDTLYLKNLKENSYKSHVLSSMFEIKETIVEMYS